MTRCPHCRAETVNGRRVERSGAIVAVRVCQRCWWDSVSGEPPSMPILKLCEYCSRQLVPDPRRAEAQRFCSHSCAGLFGWESNPAWFGARRKAAAS